MKKMLMVFGVAVFAGALLTGCGDSKEVKMEKLSEACVQESLKDPTSMGQGKACKEAEKFAKKHNLM